MNRDKLLIFRERFEYLCILWITLVTFMGFYGPQPLFATISQEVGVAASYTSLLMTVVIAPFVVGPFIYGKVLRIVALRRLLFWLLPLNAFSLFLPSVLPPSYTVLIICRLCQGITLPGILMCLTTRIASRWSGSEVQKRFAIYASITFLGSFIGRIVAGYVGSQSGWQMAFCWIALMQFSTLIPWMCIQESSRTTAGSFNVRDIISLYSISTIRRLMCIGALAVFCYASLQNFLPFYVRHILPSLSDFAISLIYLGGIISTVVGFCAPQFITMLRGEWNVIITGLVLLIISAPILLVENIVATIIAMFGCSAGFSCVYSLVPGLVNRRSTLSKSMTNSAYLALYYFMSASGTFLPFLIFSNVGIEAYLALIIGVCVFNLCMVCSLRKEH